MLQEDRSPAAGDSARLSASRGRHHEVSGEQPLRLRPGLRRGGADGRDLQLHRRAARRLRFLTPNEDSAWARLLFRSNHARDGNIQTWSPTCQFDALPFLLGRRSSRRTVARRSSRHSTRVRLSTGASRGVERYESRAPDPEKKAFATQRHATAGFFRFCSRSETWAFFFF